MVSNNKSSLSDYENNTRNHSNKPPIRRNNNNDFYSEGFDYHDNPPAAMRKIASKSPDAL